jgi:glycosyltransferase involved in cell wall biosynthesis
LISVIVPVRNEESFLTKTIVQLVSQDYRADRFEILIVDGRSTDQTRSIAESLAAAHSNVQVLDNPKRQSSAARNIGVCRAQGELVVIVDGHCELESRSYLRNLVNIGAVVGQDSAQVLSKALRGPRHAL